MRIPELLSPAGTLKNLRYAFAYGADAVYAGQPRYSLRVRNNDFLEDNLAIGIREAHQLGKKFFVALNVMPHNAKVRTFLADVEPIIAMGPDALIMADPGLIMMVRERWPEMPIHLSVQANTVNYAGVKFWKSVGVERVILSRELSLDEIAEIRQECPDTELEVFVHGALCIAYSGRCLLSGYFNHRDPNQGTCTNACRWEYKTLPGEEDVAGVVRPAEAVISMDAINAALKAGVSGDARHPLADQVYLLEEANRPGELMPIFEDEHGTYIMNSKDLRAIEHVQRLTEIGVDCLKIEGRTKSHYYAARTAQIYRQAIDDAVAGRPFDPSLIGKLESLAHRGYTDGFFVRHHTQDYQNYLEGASRNHAQQFVGEIVGRDPATGLAEVEVKNKISVGDRMELILPSGNHDFVIEDMRDLEGRPLTEAPGSGWRVRLPLPAEQVELGLLARYL
ncbi:tRNA 5-hydroxyuridine modification protein YegQ [Thiofaba sp. EF100]|jgi:putative protease|uniref:prephenate-dependent tRNA uridine(34) hydroxylase TrhP n=1 Tax=Thiofaba sp. EF100 TaxID=3121274 RepID=UPI003221605C